MCEKDMSVTNGRSTVCVGHHRCLCYCKFCTEEKPSHCAHRYFCTCEAFAGDQVCKHLHLLINEDASNENVSEESDYAGSDDENYIGHDHDYEAREDEDNPEDDTVSVFMDERLGSEGEGNQGDDTVSVFMDERLGSQDPEITVSVNEDEMLGQEEHQSSAQVQPGASGPRDVEITMDNFDHWRRHSLTCVTYLERELKKLEVNEDGLKQLKEIRDMKVRDAKLPTGLQRASKERIHKNQPKGFPTKLPKIDTKRRKKLAPANNGDKEEIDEALASEYTDDVWGRLTHHPDAKAIKMLFRGYPAGSYDEFMEKGRKAHEHWSCNTCATFDYKKFDGDYARCDGCQKWSHFKCTGLDANAPEEEEWRCHKCVEKGIFARPRTPPPRPRRPRQKT